MVRFVCRGICKREAVTPTGMGKYRGSSPYEVGFRWCRHCSVWFKAGSVFCMCCKKRLDTYTKNCSYVSAHDRMVEGLRVA